MKRTIKTIGTFTAIGVIALGSYLLGIAQAETITKVQTVTEVMEVIPDGCIDMESEEFRENYVDMRKVVSFDASDDGLQLYCTDGRGYWLELRRR